MTDAARLADTQDIVLDETFPHAPAVLWRALTDGELIGRWLMQPKGFAAVTGNRFTYQTTPAGAWDGVIRCEVLEVRPNERLVYSWTGGDAAMSAMARSSTPWCPGPYRPSTPARACSSFTPASSAP